MPSTFFGLTIASSGLSAFQASVNAVANNISNVGTKGYSRQEAIKEATDALRTNMRYGTVGTGVEVTAIKQVRDLYYDVKYWNGNSDRRLYESRLYYSQQVEDYLLDDDSMKGFSTILSEMFNALNTLQPNAGDLDKRQQFISKAQNLVNYFSSISSGMSKIQDACNREIATQVGNINSIGKKIASLNKQINIIELQGGYANELRDQRALLVDELSGLVSVECKETPVTNSNYPDMYLGGTEYVVKINGQTLVNSFSYNELECVAREKGYKVNQSDNEGLYDVRWASTKVPLATTSYMSNGSLRALFEMRDGNNRENFRARVSGSYNEDISVIENGERKDKTVTKLELTGASIKDIKGMTMNDTGIITVKNKDYRYQGFSYDAQTDTYTFTLEERLDAVERANLTGKAAEIGTSIDAMGVPYYMAQMNNFLRAFCEKFNDLQLSGQDANGDPAQAFFVAKKPDQDLADGAYTFGDKDPTKPGSMETGKDTYYRLTAENLSVAYALTKDPSLMATVKKGTNPEDVDKYDLVEQRSLLDSMVKLKTETIYRGGGADSFLKCLITDNSVDTQKAKTLYDSSNNITNAIDQRRMSVSGVDEDEEALSMLKYQNAYNLAAKMIQTMTEMYDRLILETGV